MAGLQRSVTSFRRQGSSGMVWDDKFLNELNQLNQRERGERGGDDTNIKSDQDPQIEQQDQVIKEAKPPRAAVGSISTIERSRSNGGGRAFRTGKVSPAIEPPSPRVSACGFCSAFGKKDNRRRPNAGKRRK